MPTKKQLHYLWASEMEYGLGHSADEGYNVRGSSMAGTGAKFPDEFTGPPIGTIQFDPAKKDFKIIPYTDEELKKIEEEKAIDPK